MRKMAFYYGITTKKSAVVLEVVLMTSLTDLCEKLHEDWPIPKKINLKRPLGKTKGPFLFQNSLVFDVNPTSYKGFFVHCFWISIYINIPTGPDINVHCFGSKHICLASR